MINSKVTPLTYLVTMKLLHIIPSMNPKLGGPSQGIRNYEFGLKGKNTERHVVCFDSIDEVKNWSNSNLILHPLGERKTKWQYNEKLSDWLLKIISNYEVVIINGLWLYHSYIVIKIVNRLKEKRQKSPKVFTMPHGMLDPWFQRSKSRRLKALKNEIYWKLIEKNVVNSADGILFTCAEELELAKKTFKGYKPKDEINIGYGIEEPPIQTIAMDEAIKNILPNIQGKKYWLFLGRINEKKGVDLSIEAYQILFNEHEINDLPDLVIAGPGIESDFGKKIKK